MDYLYFCKAAKLVDDKAHLTENGLVSIKKIKSGMNISRKNKILNFKSNLISLSLVPSPENKFSINYPLESNNIIFDHTPLENLITSLFTLNIFILFLTISLLFLIFNRYIILYNLEFISTLIEKYLPNKFNGILKTKINKGIDYNSRFIFIMFTVNSILLILILLLSIFICAELLVKIDDYVTVYNQLHINKSFICLFLGINNNNNNLLIYNSSNNNNYKNSIIISKKKNFFFYFKLYLIKLKFLKIKLKMKLK
jgi:hypothetical protein